MANLMKLKKFTESEIKRLESDLKSAKVALKIVKKQITASKK